ncbi:MAG: ribonuclease J [Alphaproteobacteria bacterium]|nr:MAG: ribonuclease J [Alphaproteobacteria bacterium]
MNRNQINNLLHDKKIESEAVVKSVDFDLHSLYFLPLGGSGEFGINLNLYHCNGKWILVDLGMSFEELPGSNVILPDISFIKTLDPKDILGLIITHGHEDHIGAIPYLIKEIRTPIYAGPFTSSLIKNKLLENKVKAKLHTVEIGKEFSLDPFKIKLINVTHSIPESSMVYIKTPLGNIMHTGDWKFDTTPVLDNATDYDSLKKAAEDKILLAVCDSTNAISEASQFSETDVKNELDKVISKIKGNRIVIGCFSSNIARIDSCARLAKKHHRKVALVGRSMHKIKEAASEHGYFQNLPEFLSEKDGNTTNRNEILFICTGSQGEINSGLKRMSEHDHPRVKLEAGDTVIVSAKTIIGREREVAEMLNNFAKNDINVITYSEEHPIHASGHPVRNDLREFYSMIRPKFSIPVHGERIHQNAHADLLHSLKIKSLVPSNGDIVKISPHEIKIVDHIEVSKSVLDGKAIIPYTGRTILERRWLENGCIFVSIVVESDGKFKLVTSFCGICEKEDPIKQKIRQRIKSVVIALSHNDKQVQKTLVSVIRKTVKYAMFELRSKDPAIFVYATILGKPEEKQDLNIENLEEDTDILID